MTSVQRSGRSLPRAFLIAALAVAITVFVTVVAGGWPPNPQPRAGGERPSGPSPALTATVRCEEEPEPLAPGLAGEACPSALVAVELAVAPVRLPISRIVIEAGPLYCDLLWPGVQTVRPCHGYPVQPGQFMYAWVTFTGSAKVAVVMLGLDLPDEVGDSGRTRPPWQTTLVTVEIPPDGWVMP